MSQMDQAQSDEIDLFELVQTLWRGKWFIAAFVIIAGLIGSAVLLLKEPVYESRMAYAPDTIPPFYAADKALSDFRKRFYSSAVFESWQEETGNTALDFADISMIKVVDGFMFAKDEEDQLVTLSEENTGGSFILVRRNEPRMLRDIFKYANYINDMLRDEYVIRANYEINIIEARLNDISSPESNMFEMLLPIDRYVLEVKKGAKVLAIQNPTLPEKISPNISLIMSVSLLLGSVIGAIWVLLRHAIAIRDAQMAER